MKTVSFSRVLLIAVIMLAMGGCSSEHATNVPTTASKKLFNLFGGSWWNSQPSSSGEYDGGQFYAFSGEQWRNFNELTEGQYWDSVLLRTQHTVGSSVTAAFGSPIVPIAWVKVNNMPLNATGSNPERYWAPHVPLYFNTAVNTFEWSWDGTTHYTHTISVNSPSLSIESPEFMDTLDRSSDVTITWTPSPDTSDYVMVGVTVEWALDGSWGDGMQEFSEDTGSFTIPASILRNARKVTISLARGVAQEAWYGGKKYLFVVAKGYSTQCMVR
jgi:hypothetical protein